MTPWTVVHQAPPPWDSPSKNTGEGFHSLLQSIFLTQGSNLGLLHSLDLNKVKFRTDARWWAQILKVVVGLVITLALIEGPKFVLGKSELVTGLRYGLGVLFATGIWPMTFGWFARLGGRAVKR